ncbi:MAG: lytic transglycosylase domain-containing protein [Pseudomonadota bacterium]|nr:lytic transglycosylase domain-containing protein [Pseudomonadota bacterium]
MNVKKIVSAIAIASLLTLSSPVTQAVELSGTVFEEAATQHGIDPLLLYSVALAESASGRGDNNISPWAWTLRTVDGPFYALTKEQAVKQLEAFIAENGVKGSVDIGFMQVNLYWHGHRVSSPLDLLDPAKNLATGAEILKEALKSAPNDLELGIGRYHHWGDPERSRQYGRRVLSIYQQLSQMQSQETSGRERYAANLSN